MSQPTDDLANDAAHHGRHPLRFDGTVNIPTILMLLGMVVGGMVSLIGVYNSITDHVNDGDHQLSMRITLNESDIKVLKSQAADTKSERERDRVELQTNLRDINAKLDRLVFERFDSSNKAQGSSP